MCCQSEHSCPAFCSNERQIVELDCRWNEKEFVLFPATLLKMFISCKSSLVKLSGSLVYTTISSENKATLISSIPIFSPCSPIVVLLFLLRLPILYWKHLERVVSFFFLVKFLRVSLHLSGTWLWVSCKLPLLYLNYIPFLRTYGGSIAGLWQKHAILVVWSCFHSGI